MKTNSNPHVVVILSQDELRSFLEAKQWNPHHYLGLHPLATEGGQRMVARTFLRDAKTCEIVDVVTDERFPLTQIAKEGFFEGIINKRSEPFRYRIRVTRYNGEIHQFYDPYAFTPTITDQDLYLFNEGNEHFIYRKLGAHPREIHGVPGVSFAVWAPNAARISVVGDFNNWDGRYHPMRALGASGVWEIFIPGVMEGAKYKYEIYDRSHRLHLKTDPYATSYDAPPYNASVVRDVDHYEWNDQDWMEERAKRNWQESPISIYEIHLGSWRRVQEDGNRPLSYREAADQLTAYVKEQGFTHVEFLPLAEHPFDGSWGYQVTGFFAPTQRFGPPEDFQYLVDTLHRAGIGVIMDWVPAHFPTDAFALAKFDGSSLYEHDDPRQGFHQDWGTLIPNFGRLEVRCFLVASALAWLDRYHIDGLRVDAVASMLYLDYSRKEGEWIPNQYGGRENLEAISFLRHANGLVHHYYPGAITIAEESTSFGGVSRPAEFGGLGFDFKWNMGWMHDTLQYFQKDPIYRKYHHHNITFGMIYQYHENFVQVFSHDEVVHGKASMLMKMAAPSISAKASTLRALYAMMWAWPGKKTLFMGSEFGQSSEWRYDQSLDWHLLQYPDHSGIQMIIRDLNELYQAQPAMAFGDSHHEGFEWVTMNDAEASVFAFLRKGKRKEDTILVVGHYTPVARHAYTIGVPHAGYWRELINSDASYYGGKGEGNMGGRSTDALPWDGHPHSLKLTLPGNSTLIFKWVGEKPAE